MLTVQNAMLHASGDHLHDFYIGVTMISPMQVTPKFNQYALCTTHNGPGATGATITLTCDRPDVVGRYLIVHMPRNGENLAMCELEVYGGMCDL